MRQTNLNEAVIFSKVLPRFRNLSWRSFVYI